MTLEALTHHTARMLGYDDADDLDESPRALMLEYLNQAVAQAALDRYMPQTTQSVTLDADGCFQEQALSRTAVTIHAVQIGGVDRPFHRIWMQNIPVIRVPGGEQVQAVVFYGYQPEALAPSDEPPFPPWFHPYLADYAAARMLAQGGSSLQQRARFYLESWYGALARLHSPLPSSGDWRHLYSR